MAEKEVLVSKAAGGYSSGCQDIYNKVYDRVMAEGGPKLKAILYARVAAANCESKGAGDPAGK